MNLHTNNILQSSLGMLLYRVQIANCFHAGYIAFAQNKRQQAFILVTQVTLVNFSYSNLIYIHIKFRNKGKGNRKGIKTL